VSVQLHCGGAGAGAVLGILAACEILAQKFPVLDNVWDFVHTLLRPIAGALAAGATLTTDNAFQIVLAMLMVKPTGLFGESERKKV
jgi:branched-subunit amino acid ABC-type transport system permease component